MREILGYKKILFVGIGGGGDVVSAALFAKIFRDLGIETYVASIIWERFVHDPVPGPIPLEAIHGKKMIGKYAAVINGYSYAIRNGNKVVFEAARVAETLKEDVYLIDIWGGVKGYVEALKDILLYTGADYVVGIDVGGDVLAIGDEDELWSPLADAMGLAAIHDIGSSALMVYSPGADGELPQELVLERISLIAGMGGYLGSIGVGREYVKFYEKLLENTHSEASRVGLLALKGFYGVKSIRGGTREISVSPVNTIAFILAPEPALNISRPARLVRNTGSFIEAWRRLRENGIATEYDLENSILEYSRRAGKDPRRLSAGEIMMIKNHLWKTIKDK